MSPSGNPAKVVSLRVKPSQAAQLALENGGIVGEWNVTLGAAVTAFDFATFYANLGTTVTGSPAQLQFDSQAIHAAPAVVASTLLALRAEPLKAAVDAAIAARANAYYAKYANQAAIIAQMQQSYSPTTPGSKPQLLADLSNLAQQQAAQLQAAYSADGRLGVVRTTTNQLQGTTVTQGASTAGTSIDTSTSVDTGTSVNTVTTTEASAKIDDTTKTDTSDSGSSSSSTGQVAGPVLSPGPPIIFGEASASKTEGLAFTSSTVTGTDTTTGTDVTTGRDGTTGDDVTTGKDVTTGQDVEQIKDTGEAVEQQMIVNTGYDYRVPSIENLARNDRAQVSLIDEQFAQFMAGQNLPYLDQVFSNELAMIDLAVKRLQVAYLNTILLSPISGVITGVFTNPGDPVRAGDVIIRVEDNQAVFLEGTLVYRGMISLGDTVTVRTSRCSDPAMPVTVTGSVAAAQGHESGDDRWNVAISCDNLGSNGSPLFPLHYTFDYDDTTVAIS